MATEETQESGRDFNQRVREVVHEGNVRYFRVVKGDRVYVDVPLTLFLLGVIIGPFLVVVGLVTALVKGARMEFIRRGEDEDALGDLAGDLFTDGMPPDEPLGHA
jgi:hypothetical protein